MSAEERIEEFSLATRLDRAAKAGATTIVVRAPVLFWAGRQIRLKTRDGLTTELATVSSTEGRTVTLSTGIGSAYPAGAVVQLIVNEADLQTRQRSFFVPCIAGYNHTLSAAIVRATADEAGFPMPDNNVSYMFGDFVVPQDFDSDLRVYAYVISAANGDLYRSLSVNYGGAAEAWQTHSTAVVAGTVAVLTPQHKQACALSLTDAAVDDLVHMAFARIGTNAADTVGDIVRFVGFVVSYVADS